jgi:hypothetical protein
MAATVAVKENGLTFGAPVELFQTRSWITVCGGQYDISRDGRLFLVNSRLETDHRPMTMTIVTNWTALLKN